MAPNREPGCAWCGTERGPGPRPTSRSPRSRGGPVSRAVPGGYATIQAAIDASSDGDTVNVSPGTYVENLDFHGKNITVRGTAGFAGATLVGDGVHPVVTFANGESRAAVLRGFEIR